MLMHVLVRRPQICEQHHKPSRMLIASDVQLDVRISSMDSQDGHASDIPGVPARV